MSARRYAYRVRDVSLNDAGRNTEPCAGMRVRVCGCVGVRVHVMVVVVCAGMCYECVYAYRVRDVSLNDAGRRVRAMFAVVCAGMRASVCVGIRRGRVPHLIRT